MVTHLAKKIFGSRNDRLVRRYAKSARKIGVLEAELEALDDAALAARTADFRRRLEDGEALEALMPEAFATVREAGRRVLAMRHFDVQLIGGMVLNDGKIAEMRTGEGKTLVATLAAYLNALPGKGTHVVTVNDYLARRDAVWMGKLYHFLGLSVGVINSSGGLGADNSSYVYDPEHDGSSGGHPQLRPVTRREAYAADITYGTNNEFGFDYLRDNMAFSATERTQRGLHFAIVDEVDSILIDEARTPLIISGPSGESSELYKAMNSIVPKLERQLEEDGPGDYSVDEKAKAVYLTEEGHERAEALLAEVGLLEAGQSLYDAGNINLVHHLNAALRAQAIFQRDVDYIVRDGQVIIVDEFTGRTMPGRRWSDGLHQAVEAKEDVHIQQENQTLASITFQNYFRLYDKLSGMTGTADTEAFEFQSIYNLEVVVIPTHRDMVRADYNDLVYLTQPEKFGAIIEDIKHCVQERRPVLVGTTSIETSELLAQALSKEKIEHQVLNAKQHEREAHVIAQAGRPGTVTIATNMAGRGTDIVLGGSLDAELEGLGPEADEAQREAVRAAWQERHDAVIEAGGLHIIGTERHESRRIDNQLRGRSGRQGDPGSTRFYLSLEDTLMRIFASDRVKMLMQRLGMQEGEAIENKWVTKAIENAQRKVEAHNFDMRKHLLQYDDVANEQRKLVYQQRAELLESEDIAETIEGIREDVIDSLISVHIPPGSIDEEWDPVALAEALESEFGLSLDIKGWLDADPDLDEEALRARVQEAVTAVAREKEEQLGADVLRRLEKDVMLQVLDNHWKEHLAAMDYLRQGIGFRGYAQKNPEREYKREGFEMFQAMLDRIRHDVISLLMRVRVRGTEEIAELEARSRAPQDMQFVHSQAQSALDAPAAQAAAGGGAAADAVAERPQTFRRDGRKIGRNEPCWCGSGKKFKQCHGKLD
jgi:preprotein translocase subunit SecA